MSVTPPPSLTPTPTPAPQRGDRATFADRFDAFITWIVVFVSQVAALAANVYANAADAFASATAAASSAGTAQTAAASASFAASVTKWVSGTSYAEGACVFSPVNQQTYRRKTAGAGTTDPSTDTTNWTAIARQSTFTSVPVAALDIDLRLGDYFTKTIAGGSTFTISNTPAGGSSFTLEVQMDSGSIVLPASCKIVNDSMPTLAAGKTHMLMFVTKNGGTRWRVTIAPNFVN